MARNRHRNPNEDKLYNLILEALGSLFATDCLEWEHSRSVINKIEALLNEHHENPENSRLKRRVPEIGRFFTPLPFTLAFEIYDEKYRVTCRKFIPPSFDEVRHIMNIAQVIATREQLKLISFDGDETLYPDGRNFEDAATAELITSLLARGISVAIVTAAGYGYQADRYEERIGSLLRHFRKKGLEPNELRQFYLFGGESNYLLRANRLGHLEAVSEKEWYPHSWMANADPEDIAALLDAAEASMRQTIVDLNLRASIVRKERAVGLIPGGTEGRQRRPRGSGGSSLKREILEETLHRLSEVIAAKQFQAPYCAFNGGNEVWIDIGNKAEGLLTLQRLLNLEPSQCVHIGDQFSASGNDIAARMTSPTIWIRDPEETKAVLRSYMRQLKAGGTRRLVLAVDADGDPLVSDVHSEGLLGDTKDDTPESDEPETPDARPFVRLSTLEKVL